MLKPRPVANVSHIGADQHVHQAAGLSSALTAWITMARYALPSNGSHKTSHVKACKLEQEQINAKCWHVATHFYTLASECLANGPQDDEQMAAVQGLALESAQHKCSTNDDDVYIVTLTRAAPRASTMLE